MSHLKALKLANAEPARPSADPVERARETVIAALSEQKAMAEAKISGTEYIAVHIVTRKDAEGRGRKSRSCRSQEASSSWLVHRQDRQDVLRTALCR